MGTHKPRNTKGGKRGRPSKLLNDANIELEKKLKENNYREAAEIAVISSFIESDKNELVTELLTGLFAFKELVSNDWNIVNKEDFFNNSISKSERITSFSFSDERKSEIVNTVNRIFVDRFNSKREEQE